MVAGYVHRLRRGESEGYPKPYRCRFDDTICRCRLYQGNTRGDRWWTSQFPPRRTPALELQTSVKLKCTWAVRNALMSFFQGVRRECWSAVADRFDLAPKGGREIRKTSVNKL